MSDTETGAASTAAAEAPHGITLLLKTWVDELIANSPVSRATEAWTHLHTVALPDLERRLKEMF